jgi:hypothetical protein
MKGVSNIIIIQTVIISMVLLGSVQGQSQNQWFRNQLVEKETLVILQKLGLKGREAVVGKGYVLAANDNSIDFVNAKKLPAIVRASVSIDQIDLIYWKSRVEGYKDSKVMNRSGINVGLLGAGLGTMAAVIVDLTGGLQREVSKGFQVFCDPDGSTEHSFIQLSKCETRTTSYSYQILIPAGFAIGYLAGRAIGKNIRIHRLEILGSHSNWQDLRHQIPLVSLSYDLE